jgi:hypothetical protein
MVLRTDLRTFPSVRFGLISSADLDFSLFMNRIIVMDYNLMLLPVEDRIDRSDERNITIDIIQLYFITKFA